MNKEYLEQLDRKIAALERELEEKRQEKALILSCSIPATVGDRLKKARLMQGLSIPHLGARANVYSSDIISLETNQSHQFTKLKILSEVLGVSYKYLKDGEYQSEEECDAFNIYDKAYIDVTEASLKGLNWDMNDPAAAKAIHALEREGYITIEDVVTKSPKDLMKIRSFGIACLNKLKEVLAKSKIPLKGEWKELCESPAMKTS